MKFNLNGKLIWSSISKMNSFNTFSNRAYNNYILNENNLTFNSKSKFFLSLHISYPNFHDKKIASKNKVNPGKHIAIHGLPSIFLLSQYLYNSPDWTDGCIALSNSDIKDLWDITNEGTQILIRP